MDEEHADIAHVPADLARRLAITVCRRGFGRLRCLGILLGGNPLFKELFERDVPLGAKTAGAWPSEKKAQQRLSGFAFRGVSMPTSLLTFLDRGTGDGIGTSPPGPASDEDRPLWALP